MSNTSEINRSAFKLGIAIASVFCPVVSLIEPASSFISDILLSQRSLSEIESKIKGEIASDLTECVKKTLELMKEANISDTTNKIIDYLKPYIEYSFSRTDIESLTCETFEDMITQGLEKSEANDELYIICSDVNTIISMFRGKFELLISQYPKLGIYYSQHRLCTLDIDVQKLKEKVNEIDEKHNQVVTVEALKLKLKNAFDKERSDNPSVANISYSIDLLPTGEVQNYPITANINKERNHVNVCDFFSETWNSEKQNHISITGIGGIGKTVALLQQCYPVPTIYIPLRHLTVSPDDSCQQYITTYIEGITLGSLDGSLNTLTQLCSEPWEKGPKIILLLDGLNEVTASKLDSILNEIASKWAKMQGLQLIFTSRYDINTKLKLSNVHQVLIDPLSKDVIKKHLQNVRVEIPNEYDRLWEIIDTPLMLMLYCRSEQVKSSHDSEYATWKEARNGGSIIWNYLQSELCLNRLNNKLESIVAIHFVAPFICYKMMINNYFDIGTDLFKRYIKEAVNLYFTLNNQDTLPNIIAKAIDENEAENINRRVFYNLLTKKFSIFRCIGNTVQLVHQHFRDCLAAIHMIQLVDNATIIPAEWKSDFDSNVKDFICDLLSTEEKNNTQTSTWDKVWNFGHQKEDNAYEFTSKMLNIYKNVYGNDISEVDFDSVDLRQIPLNSFMLTEKSKRHFVNSKLGYDTFRGNGHSGTVSSTSWSIDGKYYISASHDCTIRIHNSNNDIQVLTGPHMHYIRCAKCSPTDENVIVSAGDDQQLIWWTRVETSDETGQMVTSWIPKTWGQCSDWIRSLAWDTKGRRIVCGDGMGNIKLFDGSTAIVFEHKHEKNVRHLAWLNSENITAIASGSDDGMFCIWAENGNCLFEKSLGLPITSINWVQNGRYIAVSVSKKIYFYKVGFLTQKDIPCIELFSIKCFVGEDISCIASASKDAIDYMAVFDKYVLKIMRLSDVENELQYDVLDSRCYAGESNKIITAEWNRDCDKLISGSRNGSVICFNILIKEENDHQIDFNVVDRRSCKAARCSKWSPNGKWLAVGYDDCSIRIWNPFKERCLAVLKSHTDSVKSLDWAPDSFSLVSGSDDKEVKVWTGNSITQLKPKTVFIHEGAVNAVLWLKNNTIISSGDDGMVSFISADNPKNAVIKQEHFHRVYSLAASPNEDFLISGGNDDYIVLWDLNSMSARSYNSGHELPIRALAWSNDGSFIISSSNDCTINLRFFDYKERALSKTVIRLPKRHDDFIYGANISGNDLYVIGGSSDFTVGFWGMPSKDFIYKSDEHQSFVWNVSSSPRIGDSFYVATSSSDGTVKIWDLSMPNLEKIVSCFNLPVIPEIDIVGCDFSGAIVTDDKLKKLLINNGGVFNNHCK